MIDEGSQYRALWAASLSDAISSARKYLRRNKLDSLPDGIGVSGDQGEDLRWIASDSPRIGGFVWVCLILDQDPEWVRQVICKPRLADGKVIKRLDEE